MLLQGGIHGVDWNIPGSALSSTLDRRPLVSIVNFFGPASLEARVLFPSTQACLGVNELEPAWS
jgi:hypothetical protein